MTLQPSDNDPQIGGKMGLKPETSGDCAISELCALSELCAKSGKDRGPLLPSGELAESVVVVSMLFDISESEGMLLKGILKNEL